MSQILGVNDPYVIPGTMGGGGSSLPAGSDTQIQFNDGSVMAGSSALTFDKTKKTLSLINVHFSPTTMADDSVSGETFTGTAGENLVWGDVVYLKSDGKFWKADFNATTTTPAVAFCTGTINADASGEFLRRGWIRDDSAYNFTFGAQAGTIYLGESGAITQTAPSGSGDQVQVLGWALEADIWYFDPQFVIVEV